jgi:hypothetical protein
MKSNDSTGYATHQSIRVGDFNPTGLVLFRFTKFWEKNIVIIREKWSVGIMINKEWLEPRLA